jgi:archaellum component FlaC
MSKHYSEISRRILDTNKELSNSSDLKIIQNVKEQLNKISLKIDNIQKLLLEFKNNPDDFTY